MTLMADLCRARRQTALYCSHIDGSNPPWALLHSETSYGQWQERECVTKSTTSQRGDYASFFRTREPDAAGRVLGIFGGLRPG